MECLDGNEFYLSDIFSTEKKRPFLKFQASTPKLICRWLRVLKVCPIKPSSSNMSNVEQKLLLAPGLMFSPEAERTQRDSGKGGYISKVADNYVRRCYIWRIRWRKS